MKEYFVYIATNSTNHVLYIGVTNNIERRAYEHTSGQIEGFTKKYKINKIVFVERFQQITEAIAVEKKLKGWNRAKKISLIEKNNPLWRDLLSVCAN